MDHDGSTRRPLVVVGAATSAGAYGPGQEQAPLALRDAGLLDALADSGRAVNDVGDVVRETWRQDRDRPDAANVDVVADAARSVAAAVTTALAADADVLVLGGDCTVELGTVAGSLALPGTTGLIYVDLDGDLNTPASGDGVLDWMGVAHLLDVPGSRPELCGLAGRRPMLQPDQLRMVAVDRLTDFERDVVARLDITVHGLDQVLAHPGDVVDALSTWATAFDRVLLHVDVDVLDFSTFPMAHETRVVPALQLEQLDALTCGIRTGIPHLRATTVCEINPHHIGEPTQVSELISLLTKAI